MTRPELDEMARSSLDGLPLHVEEAPDSLWVTEKMNRDPRDFESCDVASCLSLHLPSGLSRLLVSAERFANRV